MTKKPAIDAFDVPATDSSDGRALIRNGRRGLGVIVRAASGTVNRARSAAGTVASHVPETVHATRVGAHATASALQTLPDSTLKGLMASSVGLGAGLYFAGGPRLAVATGVAPALIMGAAIVLRPHETVAKAENKQ
jgi:hypothetical protein